MLKASCRLLYRNCLIAAPLFFLSLISPAAAQNPPAVNALVIVQANSIADMDKAVSFIRKQGGRVPVTIPPNALFAVLPSVDLNAWVGQAGIRSVSLTQVDDAVIASRYGEVAGTASRVWNRMLAKPAARQMQPAPGRDLINDARVAPDSRARSQSAPLAPPASTQTSEFLYGRVWVDVFLPESNGSIDASTEDWTSPMRDAVVSEITLGVNWWASTSIQGGNPSANLTFDLSFHTPFNEPSIVATGYEPITRPGPLCESSLTWIGDIMSHLGYPATCDGVRSYAHARRTATGRDWAFAIFVANSLNDSDGLFADDLFAYSYYYGPLIVETYDNDGWGISRMEIVTAHEMAHTFGALDEYADSACTDTQTSGYLNIANTNCENGTPASQDSIMRSYLSQLIAYPNNLASTPVRGMVGWRDSDLDGIYDVVDTQVQVSAMRTSGCSIGESATYSGTATDVPWLSPTRPDTSLNVITAVQYSLDGGEWRNAIPDDGAFDEYAESFALQTDPLKPGVNKVDLRACNTVGNCATWTNTVRAGSCELYLPEISKW